MATFKMTFGDMREDVKTRIMERGGDFDTDIKRWLNQRQSDIWYRHTWAWAIKSDTITLSQTTLTYDLPEEFDQPLRFYEKETPRAMGRVDVATYRDIVPDPESQTEGIPHTVFLLGREDQTDQHLIPRRQIVMNRPPDRTMTVYFDFWPYCTEMVNDGDVSLIHPSGHLAVVLGATIDGLRSKGRMPELLEYKEDYRAAIKKLISTSRAADYVAPLRLRRRLARTQRGYDMNIPPWGRD